jgi:hypothetical protein
MLVASVLLFIFAYTNWNLKVSIYFLIANTLNSEGLMRIDRFRYWVKIFGLCLVVLMSSLCMSCGSDHEEEEVPEVNERTLLMFFPWSNNLYYYVLNNIKDMKSAIEANGLKNQRVLVLLANSGSHARLFEIELDKTGVCQEVDLKEYEGGFTSVSELCGLLEDVMEEAPAPKYAITVGAHGMGWIPVSGSRAISENEEKEYWENEGPIQTRYFGGTSAAYQINTTDFATALKMENLYLEYLLFDDCYMASMEVAYDLKEVTHYLLGSTCEVMSYGLPYDRMGGALLGTPDYYKVCDEFYNFYSSYVSNYGDSSPYGTFSVTDCTQVDAMAEVMKRINASCTFDTRKLSSVQKLDGYSPVRFFDFGSYVETLCTDESLLAEFQTQLNKLVIYKVNTPYYYSSNLLLPVELKSYSGLTISDPSTASAAAPKVYTGWYQATH